MPIRFLKSILNLFCKRSNASINSDSQKLSFFSSQLALLEISSKYSITLVKVALSDSYNRDISELSIFLLFNNLSDKFSNI